jgi:hypothetical protein
MLDDLPVARGHGSLLLRKVSEPNFPQHLKTVMTNGIDINDRGQMDKFKRQCTQYIHHRNKSLKSKTIAQPDIGRNLSTFRSWLHNHKTAIKDLKPPNQVPDSEMKDVIVLACDNYNIDHESPAFVVTTYELLSGVLECIQMNKRAPARMISNGDTTSMVEIDYTSGFFGSHVIGCVGASDCDRKFFPFLFQVDITENGNGASVSLQLMVKVFNHYGGMVGRVLKDGGAALSSAAKALNLEELNCLSHMIRQGWAKRGHGSGQFISFFFRY